ncbi:hypothetical protein D3C78_1862020 [compost metagenome]
MAPKSTLGTACRARAMLMTVGLVDSSPTIETSRMKTSLSAVCEKTCPSHRTKKDGLASTGPNPPVLTLGWGSA